MSYLEKIKRLREALACCDERPESFFTREKEATEQTLERTTQAIERRVGTQTEHMEEARYQALAQNTIMALNIEAAGHTCWVLEVCLLDLGTSSISTALQNLAPVRYRGTVKIGRSRQPK